MQPGSLRASLNNGEISFADLITISPFANTVDTLELQGKIIREILEKSVSMTPRNVMQVSGIKVTYNMKMPEYQKIIYLKVMCRLCDVPKYEDIKDGEWYRVVMPSYMTKGGDGFDMIPKNARNIK